MAHCRGAECMQNQGGVERFVVEVPIARPYAGTMSLCCTAAATITLATRPYACAHVSASSVSHDVPTKCFRAASRLAPDGVVVPSQHRSDGGHDQLLEEGHHIVELVTVRADSTQGAHQLVALPRHLDREHRVQLRVPQEAESRKYSGTSSQAVTTFPHLAFRAAVSIRATEIRRCRARWRRPPQLPS